jgi:ectoine hydroxylase-related dioxygenase (phytanoyl-CoA dioxygenase family)
MRTAQPTEEATRAVAEGLRLSPYHLHGDAVSTFWQQGHLGPFRCEAPQLDGLLNSLHDAAPADDESGKKNVYDPQQELAAVSQLAQHPSILHPVAQVLGSQELSFFQARFRVKAPGRHDPQPWHQDVGKHHGGLFNDGMPIPSLTVWLSLDGADAASGGVVVLPGTHRSLLGNWRAGFAGLKDQQDSLDTSQGQALATPRGCFQMFHSWAVHCSLTNASQRQRSALILRYMDQRHALDVSFPHHNCDVH